MPTETARPWPFAINPADHLRLAKDYMKKSSWHNLNPDDVLSACYAGLVRAAIEHDPSKGKFSTFAYWKMRAEVCDTMETLSFPFRIRRETIRRTRTHPDCPASRDARMALDAASGCCSLVRRNLASHLDGEDSGNRSSRSEKYRIPDRRHGADPVACAIAREEDSLSPGLELMLAVLSDREREVLVRRLGLETGEAETLAHIADDLGVTHQRAGQIYSRAVGRIRMNMGVAS